MTDDAGLGRCPHPGCPYRWRSGRNRLCPDHDDSDRASVALSAHRSPWQDAGRGEPATPPPGKDQP